MHKLVMLMSLGLPSVYGWGLACFFLGVVGSTGACSRPSAGKPPCLSCIISTVALPFLSKALNSHGIPRRHLNSLAHLQGQLALKCILFFSKGNTFTQTKLSNRSLREHRVLLLTTTKCEDGCCELKTKSCS